MTARRKPTVEGLGLDPAAQDWRRSEPGLAAGANGGAIEVAFADALGERWVLMRVSGDPAGRVLVYNRHEWECFVDGVHKGEFDDAAR